MYGLVNKAFEQMVRHQFGEARWQAIRKIAGLDVELFLNMRQYPDELSYRMVGAMSEELQIPANELLRMTGHYWLQYTAAEGYGHLLALSGSSVKEVLRGLNQLHTRIHLIYRHLQPPSFECTDQSEEVLLLHYYSKRPGLAWFVIGLVEELGHRFAEKIQVELIQQRDDGADHDIFRITFLKDPPSV